MAASFRALCAAEQRWGVIAAAPLGRVRLLPEQAAYLRRRLVVLSAADDGITAVSLGLAFHPEEILAIPAEWVGSEPPGSRWHQYCAAYHEVNRALNRISLALAERWGGVAEVATLDGLVGQVKHVSDYFPLCVSHRAVAEAAGLGWRGLHGLIVTPEFGPALRLASVFVAGRCEAPPRRLAGCGSCRACLDACPILRKAALAADGNIYRELCRRRIEILGLTADVCGICVRRCWETFGRGGAT